MTRGIQEGDGLAVHLHLIGADVLSDAAGLAGGHMGVTDIVQKAGLAVVDMAHHHHHRRAGDQILLGILMVVDQLFFDRDNDLLLHLAAHFFGNDGGSVKVDHLAQRSHDAVLHQALDHLGAGLFHAAGQLAHADLCRDLHGNGRLFDDLQLQPAHTVGFLLLTLVALGTAALLVAELLLALELMLIAAAAIAALCHVLQPFVVLIQIDIGGLAGIDHLGLGHAGHRLALSLRRLALCLLLRLLFRLLFGIVCSGSGVMLFLRLLFGGLGALGENDLNTGHLIVLGQILKDERKLPILQHLHMVLGSLGVLGQNLRDLLGGDSEILCHLVNSVFVTYATQI